MKKAAKAKKSEPKNTKLAAPATQPKPKGKSVIAHERKVQWAKKPDDALDAALADVMLDADHTLISVAHENNVEFRWTHLNPGMQRMNLGNVLRGKLRRQEAVTVAGTRI